MESYEKYVGAVLDGRYKIDCIIGIGGMAVVFRAYDMLMNRAVAIKMLKNEIANDEESVKRFINESKAVAMMSHPNIVSIYDVSVREDIKYIVMEYVEGITLKNYMNKRGVVSTREIISYTEQILSALHHSHSKGIIHRDIKPQNVIISTEGKVKVTDFGIARVASANTINAEVMGSVHYASPEQARNGFVTNTSDIYSLGIVMYEMVTGRVPFDGESMVAVAIQHLQEEMPAPSTYAPNLPISLEKIILKCTQKNPDRRYASMDELLADLRQSLLTPDKDFVVLAPLVAGQTRVISKDELDQIQQHSSTIKPEEDEYEDDEYEDDDYDYEDDDEEEGRFLNKKMEKAVTIMGIVAAIVIVILVVYLLGSFLGVFNFGGNKKPQTNQGSSVVSEQQAEQVERIDLRGKTFDEAKTELEERGLRIVQGETEESDEFEPGQIISQDIKEGEMVEVGTKVTVVVCASAEKAPVPDVVGLDSDIAKDKLEDAGFSVNREYEYAADVETGKVIRQDPAKSTELNKGETVTIYISQGEEKTKVPNVLGKTEADAKAALKEAGFNVGTVTQENSDTVAAGQVISQSVKGDSYAAKGESINLVISKGKAEAAKYYFKAEVKADKIFESGATNVSANIELSVEGEDEPIATWTNVTNFPYTVSKSDITGATSGTIMIEWHYTDAEGVQQTSVQEASVNFQEQ